MSEQQTSKAKDKLIRESGENFKLWRNLALLLLVVISAVSWLYAASVFSDKKVDIIMEMEKIAREIALPYHILRMSMKEQVDELPMPVYGVDLADVSDTWGTARDEGRTHEGVDIFADRGTPVFSTTEGYVVRLNIGSRGGKNVMIVGPGGLFYYYAHFDKIAKGIGPGMHVTRDTVLGFVGNSGNAESTPPHLHFGIYPEQWDGMNPYSLLVNRWTD